MPRAPRCEHCQAPLPTDALNTAAPVRCPYCSRQTMVRVFPAYLRPPPVGQGSAALAGDEDASCFYHPRKRAVVPCAECGRFLCALCDLEIGERHVCPACLAANKFAGRAVLLGTRQTLHDRQALTLALLSLPLFFVIVAGQAGVVPVGFCYLVEAAVLYLVLRYWKEPALGPAPRTRVWMVLAGAIAIANVAVWTTVLLVDRHA